MPKTDASKRFFLSQGMGDAEGKKMLHIGMDSSTALARTMTLVNRGLSSRGRYLFQPVKF